VRVRGGGKVDITWNDGRLTELRLQSEHAMKYLVTYGDQSAEVRLQAGKTIVLDSSFHRLSK
jgi:hypothetical protein